MGFRRIKQKEIYINIGLKSKRHSKATNKLYNHEYIIEKAIRLVKQAIKEVV